MGTMRVAGTFDGLKVIPRNRSTSSNLISAAIAAGFHRFDTAPIYARGLAEEILGDFSSADLEISTKVGVDITSTVPQLAYSYGDYWRSLEGSLKRLRRSSIGCVLLHNPAPRQILSSEFRKFRDEVRAQGIVSDVGCSVESMAALEAAVAMFPSGTIMIGRQFLESCRVRRLIGSSSQRYVIRTLFGDALRQSIVRGSRARLIQVTVDMLRREFPSVDLVIAPRTLLQLSAYLY